MDAILEYAGRKVVFLDCDPADCIEGYLLGGKWYELPNLELIRGLAVEGNYLDVGAYIGTHSVFFGLFCPASHVFSVEPQRDIFDKLARNMWDNGVHNWTGFNAAAGSEEGLCSMGNFPANRGGVSILPGSDTAIFPIDALGLPPIALAKIDVEGKELDVLRGAEKTLANVKHLFVEMWTEETCKANGLKPTVPYVCSLLGRWGFEYRQSLPWDLHWFARAEQ